MKLYSTFTLCLMILFGLTRPCWSQQQAGQSGHNTSTPQGVKANAPSKLPTQYQKIIEQTRLRSEQPQASATLQPIVPAPGVNPVGELEVLNALKDPNFKVIDMRTKKWAVQATIKGSINIPYDEIALRLNELGCVKKSAKWNCEAAVKVVAFCNGATCSQSPTAIKIMIAEGYPADKIFYYRGGIQAWILRWLTVTEK